jgi:hypothetical protein
MENQTLDHSTRLHGNSEVCPHCMADLVHSVIPEADRHYYMPLDMPDDGRRLVFLRVIGMSSLLFDRILAWRCPDCAVTDVIPGYEAKWAKEQAYDAGDAHQQAAKVFTQQQMSANHGDLLLKDR